MDLHFLSHVPACLQHQRAPLSSTGHVVLARTTSLNVVAWHSEEPLEDFSTPHTGSLMGVYSNFLRSALLRESGHLPNGARSSESWHVAWGPLFLKDKGAEPTRWPLGQSRPGLRQPV